MQSTLFDLDSFSGKTCLEFSAPKTTPMGASSLPLWALMAPLNLKTGSGPVQVWHTAQMDDAPGVFSMLNSSEWPNDAAVCSLSDVLETGPIPEKYFLSARACSGILRRAAKRGKELPPQLRAALESVSCTRACQPIGGGREPGLENPRSRNQ